MKYTSIKFKGIKNKRFLILGISFKENCVDYRNSKSIDLIKLLRSKKMIVDGFDPLINVSEFYRDHNIKIKTSLKKNYYHCIIIAVSHDIFFKMGENKLKKFIKTNGIFFDIKKIFPNNKKNLYL